jgi:hypothetical protein
VFFYTFALSSYEIVVVKDNEPKATIIIGKDCSQTEMFGADELQKYFEYMSGVVVPIKRDSDDVRGNMILVGRSKFTSNFTENWEPVNLWDDRFKISSQGSRIFLLGVNPRGTLFSVYHLLQKLGCRWFDPGIDGEEVPKMEEIILPSLDLKEVPDLSRRALAIFGGYYSTSECIDYVDWMAKNKINCFWWAGGNKEKQNLLDLKDWFRDKKSIVLPEVRKRGLVIDFSNHNFRYLEPEGGICLTDPQSRQYVANELIKLVEENPYIDVVGVWADDGWGGGLCKCKECLEFDKPFQYVEGRPHELIYVIQTNAYIHFVNSIAEQFKNRFPEKRMSVLSYNRVRKPPSDSDLMVDSSIGISLAMGRCYKHPYGYQKCEKNKKAREFIKGWLEHTDHLFLYEYYMKYASRDLPYELGPNIIKDCQYLHEAGVKGIATQSSVQNWGPMGLNYYTLAHALWNTRLEWELFLKDFCDKYYGPHAALPMRKYHLGLWEAVLSAEEHFVPVRDQIVKILTDEVLNDCDNYLNDAKEAAREDKYKRRINLRARSLYYAKLYINGIVNEDKEALNELSQFLSRESRGIVNQYNIYGEVLPPNLRKVIRAKLK